MRIIILRSICLWAAVAILIAGCAPALSPQSAAGAHVDLQTQTAVNLPTPTATHTVAVSPATATGARQTEAADAPLPAATTPAPVVCSAPAVLTPALTEGPYYSAGAPRRDSLLASGAQGTVLELSGLVLDADCKPVANAKLDFWQADAEGRYDNSGYNFRGYLLTDSAGTYHLETLVPGLYPGRTEHIHVKVQAPGGSVLTTQLFFPGVAQNESDNIFDARNLVTVLTSSPDKLSATFTFIIKTP